MLPTDQLLSFFAEDVPAGDITTLALVPDSTVSAQIEAREDMVLAGVEECVWLFEHFGVSVTVISEDGRRVSAGARILSLTGSVQVILAVERTALNLLGRMSGIATATATAQIRASVVNDHVRVAGTRKTAPGLRYFDKKAIRLGGGDPLAEGGVARLRRTAPLGIVELADLQIGLADGVLLAGIVQGQLGDLHQLLGLGHAGPAQVGGFILQIVKKGHFPTSLRYSG